MYAIRSYYEKKRNDVLEAELLRLQELNKALEADIGGNNENFRRLAEEKDKYKMIAGLTTVRGDGVVITLKDTDSYVYYTDILLLLNELKAADVQAISINDERVVTTTEIRSAGRYIMVNGRQFVSPYTINRITSYNVCYTKLLRDRVAAGHGDEQQRGFLPGPPAAPG